MDLKNRNNSLIRTLYLNWSNVFAFVDFDKQRTKNSSAFSMSVSVSSVFPNDIRSSAPQSLVLTSTVFFVPILLVVSQPENSNQVNLKAIPLSPSSFGLCMFEINCTLDKGVDQYSC